MFCKKRKMFYIIQNDENALRMVGKSVIFPEEISFFILRFFLDFMVYKIFWKKT